jgi:hypothetical protein
VCWSAKEANYKRETKKKKIKWGGRLRIGSRVGKKVENSDEERPRCRQSEVTFCYARERNIKKKRGGVMEKRSEKTKRKLKKEKENK